MKKLKLTKMIALTSALVLGAGLSAMASVQMTFTWTGSLWESGYTDSGLLNGPTHTSLLQSDDAIGIYAFNVQPNSDGVPNPLYSVCLSPAGLLDESQHTYNVESFSAASPGIYPNAWAVGPGGQAWGINNAAYLWSTYGMAIVNNTGTYSGNQSQAAAALEFAVWTALYDSTGYGKLGGNNWTPTLTGTTSSYYTGFLNGLTSSGITAAQFTGNILEGQGAVSGGPGSGQSQEFFLLETPVPEPTTMVAGALLLLPFGASTLRLFRRNRAV